MNDNLIEIISQYLKIETNYAVIINGNYGIGKTYFFKNSLTPEIKEISIFRDDRKKYIPIHISLFGINSIEEVQTQIFFAIYPILKSKGIKLAAGIGKSIIRGVAQLKGFGNIDNYIADVDVSADEWINYDEIVLCFDDLDRKSDSLKIKDILGFINTLVENHGAKIIIIANEEKLHSDKNYTKELREKVIGVSIEFNQDVDSVYDLIIHERYAAGDKVYYKFLLENKDIIIDIVKKNENNLRNLIFFLEHFKLIYYPLIDEFDKDKDFKIAKVDKLKIVLGFTLAIATEYKIGSLNSTNFTEIQNLDKIKFNDELFESLGLSDDKKDEKKEEKKYTSIFREKYYDQKDYFYLDSIFTYITGQSSFKIDKLKLELEKLFLTEDGKIPEYQKLLNELSYFNCLEQTTKEYRKKTNKLLEFVDQGKFQLVDYPTVFHYATRFNNILNFNIDKLKRRFKKGIKKDLKNYQFDYYMHFRMSVGDDTEFKDDIQEIMKYCVKINKDLKNIEEKKDISSYIKLLETNLKEFTEISRARNHPFRHNAFWNHVSFNKFYKIINKLSNSDIIELAFYFKYRYQDYFNEALLPEKEFLISLKEKLEFPQKRKVKNLRNAALNILVKHLNDSIMYFPA